MQVDPVNPTLKAPVIKRLKPGCEALLSSFAFKFNSRRYTTGATYTSGEIVKFFAQMALAGPLVERFMPTL